MTTPTRTLAPAALLLAAAVLAAPAHASRSCSADTTQGRWMYACEGTLPGPPAGAQTATRILGACSASRTGVFTCEGTANLGGLILSQGLVGQALTQASCRGTISYTQTIGGAPAPNLDIEYVISERGERIDGLPVNSGGVLACVLRRIDK